MCPKSGECRLQALSDLFAIRRSPYDNGLQSSFPSRTVQFHHPENKSRPLQTVRDSVQQRADLRRIVWCIAYDAVMAPAFNYANPSTASITNLHNASAAVRLMH